MDRCPVYVIHGTQDEIVPFYHGEALFNLLPDSSKTVPFWARGQSFLVVTRHDFKSNVQTNVSSIFNL